MFCHVLYGSRSLQIWRSLIGFLCEPGLLLYRHKSRVIFATFEALLSAGARHFSLLYMMQTGCGAQPASCSMGFGVLRRGWSDQGVMLTTYLDLAPKLVMDGAILRLCKCAFVAWTGTNCEVLTFMVAVFQRHYPEDHSLKFKPGRHLFKI